MIDDIQFGKWLKENTSYTELVIRDVISRAKRADRILEWTNNETYLFYLEKESAFQSLSSSVKSQVKRAVKFYNQFYQEFEEDGHCFEKRV